MAKAADYIADVRRYDPEAEQSVVQKIVTHLGAALKNDDAKFVVCTDLAETDSIKEDWVEGTLGLSGDTAKLVNDVCEEMQGDNRKQRVTFYYLTARHAGKLGDI
ncbi:DUF2853 family protein [Robiginitomaculum antarcticum]|uniref:DUF2853 family protein n=1 Tax=Robiginitomaculum antarcticum TaxID=437507 RepID=UPI00035EABC4|nr:DUF2853 family protein [Robiginitomaculum antarcticum]